MEKLSPIELGVLGKRAIGLFPHLFSFNYLQKGAGRDSSRKAQVKIERFGKSCLNNN